MTWALWAFGRVVLNRQERAMRLLEEATEYAQAEGVQKIVADAIVTRVYLKDPGDPVEELAQVQMCVCAAASVHNVDLMETTHQQVNKCWERNAAEWERRHDAKVQLGIAVPRTGRGDTPC